MGTAQFNVLSGDVSFANALSTSGACKWTIKGTAAQSAKFYDFDVNEVVNENASAVVTFGEGFKADLKCVTPDASMEFGAGKTFDGDIDLEGTAGHLIILRSTVTDTAWLLKCAAAVANFVDVKDSDASSGIKIMQTNSVDSGGNTNWNFSVGHALRRTALWLRTGVARYRVKDT
jgi:hypothetical protein